MLKRKIENQLLAWKNSEKRKPLIIYGMRQCGKTYSVINFAKKYYDNVCYINFQTNPEYEKIFEGSLDVDDIILKIKVSLKEKVNFIPNKTVIIFDEIQMVPRARMAFKFLNIDGRFDIIATGSLLGVKGYGKENISIPVGYETSINMYPLNFEEFLVANDIDEDIIAEMKKCLANKTRMMDAIHSRMNELLKLYIVTGGMPEAVQEYVNTKDLDRVQDIQHDIINSYKDDMVKYAENTDRGKIRECFESIPLQLAKDNKKFQYSYIRKKSTAKDYIGSIQWIEDAGIINRCYNISSLELPLEGYKMQEHFKIYLSDIGLLISMLEKGTKENILNGNLGIYKGAIYENLVADFMIKNSKKLYYYTKKSGLEIDYIIRLNNELTLVEVKASTGNAKSLKTVLNDKEHYNVNRALKLGNYNIGENGKIYTMPLYLGAFIE